MTWMMIDTSRYIQIYTCNMKFIKDCQLSLNNAGIIMHLECTRMLIYNKCNIFSIKYFKIESFKV